MYYLSVFQNTSYFYRLDKVITLQPHQSQQEFIFKRLNRGVSKFVHRLATNSRDAEGARGPQCVRVRNSILPVELYAISASLMGGAVQYLYSISSNEA